MWIGCSETFDDITLIFIRATILITCKHETSQMPEELRSVLLEITVK